MLELLTASAIFKKTVKLLRVEMAVVADCQVVVCQTMDSSN